MPAVIQMTAQLQLAKRQQWTEKPTSSKSAQNAKNQPLNVCSWHRAAVAALTSLDFNRLRDL